MLCKRLLSTFLLPSKHLSPYLLRMAAIDQSIRSAGTLSMFPSLKDAQQHVSKTAQALIGNNASIAKCGHLACQNDTFQRILDSSTLISYASFDSALADSTSNKKKKKPVEENINSNFSNIQYVMALNDSIFFPEGGGQPADKGKLAIITSTLTEDTQIELYVSDAQNIDGICVLTCQAPSHIPPTDISNALHQAEITITQQVDWMRRFDHMTQHSAQHLISAVAMNEPFNLPTHSWSLQPTSTNYIDFTINPEAPIEEHFAKMRQVEQVVNQHIRENLPMTPTYMDPNDAEFKIKVRSRLLPTGLTGPIRLIEIQGTDLNTCCGTHVPTLGQLQMIKFFKMEKVKPALMRIYFAAGPRVMEILESSFQRQIQLTIALSCTEEEQVGRVSQLLEDKREREKQIKTLNEKLCVVYANDICCECKENHNVAVVDLGSKADVSFLTMLSAAVLEKIGTEGVLLLLVEGAEGSEEGGFLLTGDVALVDQVGRKVAEIFGGRGGGRNGRFQGKGTKVRSSLDEVKKVLINASV